MLWLRFKHLIASFREDTRGSFLVESVIALPLLFWTLAATYEFFEVHRYKSVREKATYTIADMLSREQSVVTDIYIDNAKILFDDVANDDGVNQLRVSVIRYLAADDQYEVAWSEVRGTGGMAALQDADVATAHDQLPAMSNGEEVILVESRSSYDPSFDVGLSDGINISTRVFTSLRFAPQLCFDVCTSG
ncbi:TadE/TadG family type IV pilus assembly protein [Roseovarius salis]|uniref:TadE/TadG family type IV pilus assembly protein n=1 Tax=Roseovarius salis TaxID=3376063 RepID=UPI0037C5A94F